MNNGALQCAALRRIDCDCICWQELELCAAHFDFAGHVRRPVLDVSFSPVVDGGGHHENIWFKSREMEAHFGFPVLLFCIQFDIYSHRVMAQIMRSTGAVVNGLPLVQFDIVDDSR